MAMSIDQLKGVMKYYLQGYNDEGVAIDDTTIHNTVLSEHDGIGNINSKAIYQQDVGFSMMRSSHPFKKWPENWMELSVSDLATQIY